LYPPGTVEVAIQDQYFNMREKIEPVMYIVDLASRAMREAGIEPVIAPIRGGTDGARLSYSGLPTPNLFSGGYNYHGRYEFIPVQSMEKAVDVIINLLRMVVG
jgi:tripeptide aminopeptidase